MLLSSAAREAWLNVVTGAARTLLLVISIGVSIGVLAWFDLSTVNALQEKAENFSRVGASTLVLEAQGSINGRACDRLTQVDGVRAAGAIRPAVTEVEPTATPGNDLPTYEVTLGFPALLNIDSQGGTLVSQALADDWNLSGGTSLSTTNGRLLVGDIYPFPEDGRSTALQYAILGVDNAAGSYDACWMDVWPPTPRAEPLLWTALATNAPADVYARLNQLNPTLGRELTAVEEYNERTTRWSPALAFLLTTALVIGLSRLRRLELSFARHLGMARSTQTAQLLLECAFWILPAIAISGAVVLWQATQTGTIDFSIVLLGARVVASGASGCFIGALLSGLLVSKQSLYTYFKHR